MTSLPKFFPTQLICILFTFLSLQLRAQDFMPGEIVDLEKNIVKGYIKGQTDKKNSTICIFSAYPNGSIPTSYSPSQILSYRIYEGKYYVSKNIGIENRQEIFLEYLVKGTVNLYYSKQGANPYYFIEKNEILTTLNNDKTKVNVNGISYEKSSNQYLRMLNSLFDDSDSTKLEIKKTKFLSEDLVKITKNYHNEMCKDFSCIDYHKAFKKSISWEFGSGVNISNMSVKFTDLNLNRTNIQYNIGLRYYDQRKFRKYYFRTGLTVNKESYNERFSYFKLDSWNRVILFNSDYLALRLPLTIEKRNIKKRLISPLLSFGVSPIYSLKMKYSLKNRDSSEGVIPEKFIDYPANYRNLQVGIHLKPGFYVNLNSKNYILFAFPLEYRTSPIRSGALFDTQKHYSFQPSVSFGFGK